MAKKDEPQGNQTPKSRVQIFRRANVDPLETLRQDQYGPGGKLHSPATLEFTAATAIALKQVARARGSVDGKVTHVLVGLDDEEPLLYIFPPGPEDPAEDALEIKRYERSAWVGLREVLAPRKYLVEPGYFKRYDLKIVGEESPVGPALVMDLEHPVEQKPESKGKKKSQGTAKAGKKEDAPAKAEAPKQEPTE